MIDDKERLRELAELLKVIGHPVRLCIVRGLKWAYISVIFMLLCPISFDTVYNSTPFWTRWLAKVCRSLCGKLLKPSLFIVRTYAAVIKYLSSLTHLPISFTTYPVLSGCFISSALKSAEMGTWRKFSVLFALT